MEAKSWIIRDSFIFWFPLLLDRFIKRRTCCWRAQQKNRDETRWKQEIIFINFDVSESRIIMRF